MMTISNTLYAGQPISPIVHQFAPIKVNKNDIIYERVSKHIAHSFITDQIKIEVFQGYSRGTNFDKYFRVKDQSSWRNSEYVTGLFFTQRQGVFFGNRKKGNVRTLLLFAYENLSQNLSIYEFPPGYYPNRNKIQELVNDV
jgi:hypothetical protein